MPFPFEYKLPEEKQANLDLVKKNLKSTVVESKYTKPSNTEPINNKFSVKFEEKYIY